MTAGVFVHRLRRRTREPRPERMSLAAHFSELKRRLLIAGAAVLVSVIVAFVFSDVMLAALIAPINQIANEDARELVALNFDTVTGPFDLRMRVAMAIGFLGAAPIWLSQVWLYIAPGLRARERRVSLAVAFSAGPLFFLGCAVGWTLVPHIVELMAAFAPEGSAQFYQQSYYFDFVLKLVFATGIAFVLPVLLVVMSTLGLMSARVILRGWRIAVLVAVIFAALATPAADIVSMVLLAGALIVLYFLAVLVAFLFERRARLGGTGTKAREAESR